MPQTLKLSHDNPASVYSEVLGRQTKPQKISYSQGLAGNFQNESSPDENQNVQKLVEGMAQKCEV